MQVIGNRAIWNILIYKQELTAPTSGTSIEFYQMMVIQAGEDLKLVHELRYLFAVLFIETFDCNLSPILQFSYQMYVKKSYKHKIQLVICFNILVWKYINLFGFLLVLF